MSGKNNSDSSEVTKVVLEAHGLLSDSLFQLPLEGQAMEPEHFDIMLTDINEEGFVAVAALLGTQLNTKFRNLSPARFPAVPFPLKVSEVIAGVVQWYLTRLL